MPWSKQLPSEAVCALLHLDDLLYRENYGTITSSHISHRKCFNFQ